MAMEIERKFLVVNEGWKSACTASFVIRDGLIASDGGRKARVRIKDQRASLTVKGVRSGWGRAEFEYDIPLADARELMKNHCGGRIIEKTRHLVPYGGFTWEIDVYGRELAGVVIAEIELSDMRTAFTRPDWLGTEVTGDENYRKFNLYSSAGCV